MTAATAIPLDRLTRLRRIDPAVDAAGSAAARLIEAAGLRVLAVADGLPPARAWFACEGDVLIHMPGEAPLHPERVAEAAAMLDRAEAMLATIERALGIVLEPEAVRPADAAPRIALTITDQAESAALVLAIPHGHADRDRWAAAADACPPNPATLPVLIHAEMDGPRLSIAEAEALSAGDLVLWPARAPGRITSSLPRAAATSPDFHGTIGLVDARFTPAPHDFGAAMPSDVSATDDAPRDFAVPLSLRLPDRMTSAASLAALRPGTTLSLGPIVDGLPVELLVAGRPLATGELVQLGDRFAVLVGARAPLADHRDPAADDATAAPAREAHA